MDVGVSSVFAQDRESSYSILSALFDAIQYDPISSALPLMTTAMSGTEKRELDAKNFIDNLKNNQAQKDMEQRKLRSTLLKWSNQEPLDAISDTAYFERFRKSIKNTFSGANNVQKPTPSFTVGGRSLFIMFFAFDQHSLFMVHCSLFLFR